MIQNDHKNGEVAVECDGCNDQLDAFRKEDFREMIEAAKAKDWQVKLTKSGWTHTCPSCAKSNALARQKALLGDL